MRRLKREEEKKRVKGMTTISISSIEESTIQLRAALEQLLENSEDLTVERGAIIAHLVDLQQLFTQERFPRCYALLTYAKEAAKGLVKLDSGPEAGMLLRLTLLLEQFVETRELGIAANDQFFEGLFNQLEEQLEQAKSDDNLDHGALKLLRMFYQRQLLALIRGEGILPALERISAIINDLIPELPLPYHHQWRGVQFYAERLASKLQSDEGAEIEILTHQIFALMDHRLAAHLRYQTPEKGLLPELVQALEMTLEGERWLAKHQNHGREVYISAGVYSRFVGAIRDKLIELHENIERLHLDPTQLDRLEDSEQFLAELETILTIMDLPNLSQLAERIVADFQRYRTEGALEQEAFNRTVNRVWILEENLNELWNVHDGEIPQSDEEIKRWALIRSRRSLAAILVEEYEKLNETRKELASDALDEALGALLRVDHLSGNNHLLFLKAYQLLVVDGGGLAPFSEEEVENLILSLGYVASRRASGDPVAFGLVEEALTLLQGVAVAPEKWGDPIVEEEGAPVETTSSKGGEEDEDQPIAGLTISRPVLEVLVEEVEELEEIYQEYREILEQTTEKEQQELARVAHTLKANVQLLGLDMLHTRLSYLERVLLTVSKSYPLNPTVVKKEFDESFAEINAFIAQIG